MTETMMGAVPGARELAGWTGWAEHLASDPRQQQLNAQRERDRLANVARTLLGWVEMPVSDGVYVSYRWDHTGREQVEGLPAWAVDPVQEAALNEAQTWQVLVEAQRAAQRWIDQHRPSSLLANQKREELTIEAATAHREAEERASVALAWLGQIAERVFAARQVLRDAPARKTAIEQRAAQELRQVEQDADQARQNLHALGLDT